MVSLGDKIVVIGGYSPDDGNYQKDVYELQCSTCQWEKMEQSLQYARSQFVAIPIPDKLTDCHQN